MNKYTAHMINELTSDFGLATHEDACDEMKKTILEIDLIVCDQNFTLELITDLITSLLKDADHSISEIRDIIIRGIPPIEITKRDAIEMFEYYGMGKFKIGK